MTQTLVGSASRPVTGSRHRVGPEPDLGAGPDPVRTLLYCHDTYGLGHLSRTVAIARRLSGSRVFGPQLIVTGSPVEHRFELPPNCDSVKLPALVKVGDGEYEARSLGSDFAGIRAVRRELLLGAARAFQPDVVLVDHAPAGVGGEALPALQYLRRSLPGTRLVLGLRDVIDEPARVRATWAKEGIGVVLDELYDLILVYGRQEVVDVVADYGFSQRAAAKTRFVGYLGREQGAAGGGTTADGTAAAALLDTPQHVLVVTGGGGDGERVLSAVVEGVRRGRSPRRVGWLLVAGPLMPPVARRRLDAAAAGVRGIRVVDFVPNLPDAMRAADGIVAMGGYNTVCEILSAGRPAVVVPRVEPRLEQWVRAARLAELGLLTALHPDDATPRRVIRTVLDALDGEVRAVPPGMLEGLRGVARELEALVGAAGERVPVAGGSSA